MGRMSDGLNYNIKDAESRLGLVEGIISKNENRLVDYYSDNYNPHLNQDSYLSDNSQISKDLETLATYLLYSDNLEKDDMITEHKKKRNASEVSFDKFVSLGDSKTEQKQTPKVNRKLKVTKEFRERFKELRETESAIKWMTKCIKTKSTLDGSRELSTEEINRLKWIRTDIQKDEIAMLHDLLKIVDFQSITKAEKDMEALGHIRFDDEEIIKILIDNYEDFYSMSESDTFGYMKFILMVFDSLLEQADLEPYLLEIYNLRQQNVTGNDIRSIVKEKYGIDITLNKISRTMNKKIPSEIVKVYKQSKEDWMYTFIMKGNYKTCEKCKANKLATDKHFYKYSNSTNIRNVCIECAKKDRKNSKK